jgi:GNAT superfamily N-acetyltransferase
VDDVTLARLGHLNYLAFGREASLWSDRAAVVDEGGVLLGASGTTFPFLFNAAFRTDPGVAPKEVLERADEFFGARDRDYTVVSGPEDDDLVAALDEAGCWMWGTAPEMICRERLDDAPAPEGIELRVATDEADIADFLAVNSAAYQSLGMPAEAFPESVNRPERLLEPHLHTVVAHLDGEAVGTAQALLSHGIAGVYWVGTREAARGRGVGEAVTRAVTNWAFDQGAQAQSLQASSMGEPIYARMGYETLYRYRNHLRTRA